MLVALTLIVAAALLWWFFFVPAPPAVGRRKSLRDVAVWTKRLATMLDGSLLTVTRADTGLGFKFLKEDDSGQVEQKISLLLSENIWGAKLFEAVEGILYRSHPSAVAVGGAAPDRVLRCSLVGKPISMEFLTHDLLARIAPVLNLPEDNSLTLRLDGAINQAIWRRMNIGPLKNMTAIEQPWLYRLFGRYQLRKHTREEGEFSNDDE